MPNKRLCQLQQALLAVLTAVEQRGLSVDDICTQAVGILVADCQNRWINADYKNGAIDEIDLALDIITGGRISSESTDGHRKIHGALIR